MSSKRLATRPTRTAALIAAATLLVGVSVLTGQAANAASDPVSIDVLTINDFHGRLEADGTVAGAAVLAGAVDSFRQANPNTLFVSAGDNIGASTFTSFIQDDQPTIDALNSMKLDVSSVGNHEFDKGAADLTDRVIPAADFPYLAANVVDSATGEPLYDPYVVKEVDGVSVGFIGAVTEELPSLVSPAGLAGVSVEPIVPAVNAVADELTDGDASNGEADVVVLLVHEGAATSDYPADDSVFGRILTGVDANVNAIVSAHTHQLYNYESPVPGVAGAMRPVLQTGSYSMDLGHLSMSVDPDTKQLLSISSEVLPLVDTANGNAPLYPADPAVAAIVAKAVAVADVKGQVSVGTITSTFSRAKQSDGSENRGGESTLGNFVADVQLSAASQAGAQVAFMNPGGLRADLTYASSGPNDPDGNVTYKEAASVQPFANTLVTLDLTAAQIKTVLEEQWQPSTAARSFLKLGVSKSLTYVYDPDAATGSHITSITFNGAPLAPDATLKVVVNSFLASGGDNFFELANGSNVADSGQIDLQSMVDYFQANATASPDLAQRAIGVHIVTPPASAAGYVAGQSVVAEFSSLAFSAGEPQPEFAYVITYYSDTNRLLGSAAVDGSIVDTTDEVGRATVSFGLLDTAQPGDQVYIETGQGDDPTANRNVLFLTVGAAAGSTSTMPTTPPSNAAGGAQLANTGAPMGELTELGVAAFVLLLVGAGGMALRLRRSA